ncbi:MAG: S1C family serine protease [Chloroflexia bacterium]
MYTSKRAGGSWRQSAVIGAVLLISSLLASACDLGGSSQPSGNTPNPPTAAGQPGTTQGGNGGFNSTGGNNTNNGTTTTSGGNNGGNNGGTAGGSNNNGGPAVIPGGPPAMFDQMAGGIPINGTDVSQQPIVAMVKKVDPAVVTVVSTISGGQARGSGAIIDQKGYIITNNHVIEGSQRVQVIFSTGKTQDAQIVGASASYDLAVLKIGGQVPGVIAIGDSNSLQPGETVVAIGSALGEFHDTVTVGVVSGLHRSLPEGNGVQIQDLIQTDAAINHGNSGGPLLDLNGQLVGITTLGVTSAGQGDIAQGLGFAIPSKTVKLVSDQVINGGPAAASGRPRLGVTVQPVDPQTAGYYNLVGPDGQLLQDGEFVIDVTAGGPAEKAGVQKGDVITSVDGQQVGANNRLGDTLLNHKPGDQITLGVLRGGKQGTIKVTLGQAP